MFAHISFARLLFFDDRKPCSIPSLYGPYAYLLACFRPCLYHCLSRSKYCPNPSKDFIRSPVPDVLCRTPEAWRQTILRSSNPGCYRVSCHPKNSRSFADRTNAPDYTVRNPFNEFVVILHRGTNLLVPCISKQRTFRREQKGSPLMLNLVAQYPMSCNS